MSAIESIQTTCSSPIAFVECRDETSPEANHKCDNYELDYNCRCLDILKEVKDNSLSSFADGAEYEMAAPLIPKYQYCDEIDIVANTYFGLSISSAYLTINAYGEKIFLRIAEDPLDNGMDNDTDVGTIWCEMRHNVQLPEKYQRIYDMLYAYEGPPPSDPPEEHPLISALRYTGCLQSFVN